MKRSRLIVVLLLLLLIAAAVWFLGGGKTVYHFPGLSGPAQTDSLRPPRNAQLEDFGKGGKSRLAILVTDPESDWLGLAHGLRTIGIPFVLTRDYQAALAHKLVLVYPTISGKVLSADALQALDAFPRKGGTLLGFQVLGGGMNDAFGISGTAGFRAHKTLSIEAEQARAWGLQQEEERLIPLAGKETGMATYAFEASGGKVLARYDDGRAAIVGRDFGAGRTLAIGLDFGAYLAKIYNGRQEVDGAYINVYQPAVDTVLRTLLALYRKAEPLAVTLSTVPDGKPLSLIVTHDIDYGKSIVNAQRYAEVEKQSGISATYFIQTKYVRDWNDDIFYNQEGAAIARKLHGQGMEIASHSVAHSRVFSTVPMGDGKERYPDYVPFVKSRTDTRNASILGELRVSRFLLESQVPELRVLSFRPGHLQYPFGLPQALDATGYRYSSSVASGTAATHLPFRLNYNRENKAETPIYEFPITIEDERERPMTGRLPAAQTILQRLAAYGGMCVVLIHPDVFDDKLAFLEALLPAAKKMDAWIGNLRTFGAWWQARDAVEVDVAREGGTIVADISAPAPFSQLAFEVPAGWILDTAASGGKVTQRGATVVLGQPMQQLRLVFRQ
ncbi:polysaccharide deacetylase family protein [Massilia sp. MB5]|uniref:polysaccharide deacetylase family protein n=1 Tax=Massilia sp. MB5 TaxID=2919578 RepID=UPI001F0EEF5B|nr:polysaccharide deacetylase family protein [Massilia sp. MB5]UMR31806.1 polysaccharide deacetylase family protein [Massilia sp. MB5]